MVIGESMAPDTRQRPFYVGLMETPPLSDTPAEENEALTRREQAVSY